MQSKTSPVLNFYVFVAVTLALGVLLIYWPVLFNLVNQIATDEDFSYGLLLPLVSAYLVYLKWPEIRLEPRRPSWLGLAIMAVALCLYIAGKLAAEFYSTRISFIMFIAGVLLLTSGWKILRRLAFPLLLLVLMLPLPSVVTSSLTLPLQFISSHLAAKLLMFLGYPLVLEGNVIDLGTRQLQVVAACSGLRYVLSLLALGIIFCYFYQRTLWKAAIILVALVPAAILANALRVAAMGIYPAFQEGFWHGFSGWLIFVFCFGFLALLNTSLNYLQPQAAPAPPKSAQVVSEKGTDRQQTSYPPYFIAALAMILISGILVFSVAQPPPVPLLQSFDHFPLQLGPWQGRRTYMDPKIFEKTDADSYFDADYSCPGEPPVSLYIAHYESQSSPGGLGHNPRVCMTGSGWETVESGSLAIAPGHPVNYLILARAGTSLIVYYWNIQMGDWMALENARMYKLYTIVNSLQRQRTDWALVRLITPIDQHIAKSHERLTDFAKLLMPVLPQFIKP
jgi:exosortase D (VPLPA-CTERM-specific)